MINQWYDIRTCFVVTPDITLCPECFRVLLRKEVHATAFAKKKIKGCSIPLIETYVYYCFYCGWEAFREKLFELECSAGTDEIIFTYSPQKSFTRAGSANCLYEYLKSDKPKFLKKCIDDKEGNRISKPLPKELASWLFGWKTVLETWK